MNKFKENGAITILLFMAVFYMLFGFHFGVASNVEELPIIYYLAGIADYPNDPFIASVTEGFNYVTIYVYLFAKITSLVGAKGLPYIFFLTHFMAFFFLLFVLRRIIIKIRPVSERGVFAIFFVLAFLQKFLIWIPNQRSLFAIGLDPEFVPFPFLFASILFFLNNKSNSTALCLFFAVLFHPLYTLPIAGVLISVLIFQFIIDRDAKKLIVPAIKYFLAVVPYSIILWLLSKQSIDSPYDAGLMHEFLFAPQHLVIPSAKSHNRIPYLRFLESTFLMLGFSMFLYWYKKGQPKNIKITAILKTSFYYLQKNGISSLAKIYFITVFLLLYLLAASFISSFIRISLLVQLTPYRMVVFVFTLTIILFMVSIYEVFTFPSFHMKFTKKWNYITIIFLFIIAFSMRIKLNVDSSNAQRETKTWIRENADKKIQFLNYSDIDVRTTCFHSDYFRKKTIPLTNDTQIAWYKRFLIYYDIPKSIPYDSYQEIRKYVRSEPNPVINIIEVINRIPNPKPGYLLIDKTMGTPFSNLTFSLLYENGPYQIYDIGDR